MEPSKSAAADAIEEAIAARTGAHYVLRLYIAGTTAHSARALANIRRTVTNSKSSTSRSLPRSLRTSRSSRRRH